MAEKESFFGAFSAVAKAIQRKLSLCMEYGGTTMSKHGTAPQQVSGWYVEFQMAVLRALPRDISQEVADGWRANGDSLARTLREALLPGGASNGFLRLISGGEPLILDPTDGSRIIATALDVFPGWIDPDFEKWGTNQKGLAMGATPVVVYELAKDATFAKMFGSLSSDPRRLCLTQGQIIDFCLKHRQWLWTEGYGTFFLFEAGSKLFVADVNFSDDGCLKVAVRRFARSRVWRAGRHHRLVVPQLA